MKKAISASASARASGLRHVGQSAQFQRHREATHRDRVPAAKVGLELPPGLRAGFVERVVAGFAREQRDVRTGMARERLRLRPERRAGVEVEQRFAVAMQIDDDFGVAGQPEQRLALARQFGLGGKAFDRLAQRGADGPRVLLRVVAEAALQPRQQRREQGRVVPIEVVAASSGRTGPRSSAARSGPMPIGFATGTTTISPSRRPWVSSAARRSRRWCAASIPGSSSACSEACT